MAIISELEAMNQILSVTGDAPVSSTSSTYEQAQIAKRILNQVSQEEQAKGWWFNEVDDVSLSVDGSGYVNLPADTIRCDIDARYAGKIVQRGMRLFNKFENTYDFNLNEWSYVIENDMKVSLVNSLPWVELPQSFRQYVIAKAKLRYNAEYFGSQEAQNAILQDIAQYSLIVQSEDIDNRDLNVIATTRGYNIAFKNRK
jgi:hypothetical protein